MGLTGKKSRFSAEQRDVGPAAVAIGNLRLPIILCTTLASTDPAAGQKWQILQVATSDRVTQFVELLRLQPVLNLLHWKHFGLSGKKGGRRKGDGRTQNNAQTVPDSHEHTPTAPFCTLHCDVQC